MDKRKVAGDFNQDGRYRHMLTLHYSEMVEFILSSLRQRTAVINMFYVLMIISLLAVLCLTKASLFFAGPSIGRSTLLGLTVIPILLIPIHEAIHILVLIAGGARDIRAGADLRQFIIYVTSHRNLILPGHFITTALAPMIIITLILAGSAFVVPGTLRAALLIAIPVHLTMCIGDISLVNFYYLHRDKRVVTWDDADDGNCHFYEEVQ